MKLAVNLIGLLMVSVAAVSSAVAESPMRAPDTWQQYRFQPAPPPAKPGSIHPGTYVVKGLFFVYQKGAGPTKGTNCPSSPSCSEYSRRAFDRHFALKAFMLTVDRLNRCGHDQEMYEQKVIGNKLLTLDPVPR